MPSGSEGGMGESLEEATPLGARRGRIAALAVGAPREAPQASAASKTSLPRGQYDAEVGWAERLV